MIKQYSSLNISNIPGNLKKVEDIQYRTVDDGIVLPLQFLKDSPANGSGGVFDANFDFVASSGLREGYLQYGKAYTTESHLIRKCDEEVIWFGLFIKHWGHFLIELIGRMWYVLKNYKNQKIIYISRNDHIFDGVFLEFMTYLNIPGNCLVRVETPLQYSRVIVPDCCATEIYYSDLYREIFKKVVETSGHKDLNLDRSKNIYFSRKEFFYSKFKDFGEHRIERVFNENNYESISPEKLSLREQIYLWNNSENIVAVNGSIPLNILFSFSHPNLVVLNKTDKTHSNLLRIQKIYNYTITYVDVFYPKYAHLSKNLGSGPFIMYISPYLKAFFIDKNFSVPTSNINSGFGAYALFYLLKFYFFKFSIFIIKKMNIKRLFVK